MKKLPLYLLIWGISCQLFSQNWQQVGDLNDTPRVMLNDSISGRLYLSGNFRFNGVDTVDGFCSFDGATFASYGRRFDCGSYVCTPAFLIARYGDHLYLSGPNLTTIDGVEVKGIGKWDGTNWSVALPGLSYNNLYNPYLDSYCVNEGRFYGVGFFRTAEGDTCNSVAYWDGDKWTGLGFLPWSDNSVPRIWRSIFYQNQLYVGGNFTWEVGGGADIARLDSTGWHLVGGGLYGGFADISSMVLYKDELYVCGYFRKVDGNVGNKIMRWDGNLWKEVGAGLCSPSAIPTDMLVYDGKLYVVGIFDCVDNDLPVSNIAVWDGERWCSLGNSTFNNKLSCIAAYKGEIYVGGGFTEVDGQPCRYFAKWVGNHSTDSCSAPISAAQEVQDNNLAVRIWPNPAEEVLYLQSQNTIESIKVFDAFGKEVTQIIPIRSERQISVDIHHFAPGLYYLSLCAGGAMWGGKFVKG